MRFNRFLLFSSMLLAAMPVFAHPGHSPDGAIASLMHALFGLHVALSFLDVGAALLIAATLFGLGMAIPTWKHRHGIGIRVLGGGLGLLSVSLLLTT